MRIGILGDIHSNLEALTAVVGLLESEGVDAWVQVGDIVGYGADPVPCIERVRELGCIVCLGNHDAAVVDFMPADYFNQYARAAIDWTRAALRPEDLDFLRGLPLKIETKDYSVVHGSLHLPAQFGYVFSPVEAAECLAEQRTRVAFVGHSHVPGAYMQREGGSLRDLDVVFESEFTTSIEGYVRVLLNVGSVGQPRDEDARAAGAIYDMERGTLQVLRTEYDVATTQQKIRDAGLPSVLADRLALGV
jgi:diadenosine tetraphosphatase ApaH/serine/threonine PP2A family protein phosphatase